MPFLLFFPLSLLLGRFPSFFFFRVLLHLLLLHVLFLFLSRQPPVRSLLVAAIGSIDGCLAISTISAALAHPSLSPAPPSSLSLCLLLFGCLYSAFLSSFVCRFHLSLFGPFRPVVRLRRPLRALFDRCPTASGHLRHHFCRCLSVRPFRPCPLSASSGSSSRHCLGDYSAAASSALSSSGHRYAFWPLVLCPFGRFGHCSAADLSPRSALVRLLFADFLLLWPLIFCHHHC